MRNFSIIASVLLAILLPGFAAANHEAGHIEITGTGEPNFSDTYAFRRQGVFGCSLQGSYSMSVGSLSAVGGVYVPVNDAAVTLNTGYLVYKECVLRGVVNRQREAGSAGVVKQVVNTVNTGRDGNPYYSQNVGQEGLAVYDQAYVRVLQDGTLDVIHPSFAPQAKRAVAQGYLRARNMPHADFYCPIPGDLRNVYQGTGFTMATLGQFMNPGCNPYWASEEARDYARSVASYDVNTMMQRLGWGEGFYPVEQCDEYGVCYTVTPGSVVRSNFTQALQTGFDQLSRANDIDQIVGALFSGMTSQVLGDNRGLLGLTQPTGSQPSYLDQVVREAAQGLRDAAGNAALQILTAAKQIEGAYKLVMEAILSVLLAAAEELRDKEAACWRLIIEQVCAGPVAADKTCSAKETCSGEGAEMVCTGGGKLKIATSTTFSRQVINARITSLASTSAANIQKSSQAITLIDRLIAGITNNASLESQRVALQQLDNLVAQRALHTQYDLQDAQKARDDITASMETLRTDTVKAWTENPSVDPGWCNINNKAVLEFWKNRWKQS